MVWMENLFSSVKMFLIVCSLLSPVFSAPHKSAATRHQEVVGSDSKTLPEMLNENIPKVNKMFGDLMREKANALTL